jgi:hypothetical protein
MMRASASAPFVAVSCNTDLPARPQWDDSPINRAGSARRLRKWLEGQGGTLFVDDWSTWRRLQQQLVAALISRSPRGEPRRAVRLITGAQVGDGRS